MATIKVVNCRSVLIDGVNAGRPLDAVRNHPLLAADIQRALEAWEVEKDTGHAAALAKSQAVIDALGGSALGQKLARQKQRVAAQAAKAAAEKVLKDLGPDEV